ncbi:hypothetical protein [Paracoccus zeaxanthinifaciens]|uniref:hypothetical protein n=1 Tax=Paracoccus zeaxanthinifaciens TaxID=187400 RepID=UPI00040C1D86|nr:hypothetical protein [Paracoccus zeaxanthinifaciens]
MLRPLPILLAIVIALTSVGVGSARGTARIGGQVVICTGEGVTSVPDPRGGQVHLCPDMALALLSAPMPEGVSLPRPAPVPAGVLRPAVRPAPHAVGARVFRARDPPVVPIA